MSMRTKVIGRQPTDHGPYDPQFAYGKKFTVTLFDCGWESKHDNNTSAPATLNAQAGTITENTTDWKKVWGSYKQWLIDNGYQKMDASDVKDGNNTQHDINVTFASEIGNDSTPNSIKGRVTTLEGAVGTGGSVDERIAAEGARHYLKSETYTKEEVNGMIAAEGARHYLKSETYTKEEVNGMITTPEQGFVSVSATSETTAATDVLPATGEADTIYRVANWDGTQYDTSVYSEYTWNTSTNTYIKLSTKQVGIDDEPTAGSDNLVKSGGVFEKITPILKYMPVVNGTAIGYNGDELGNIMGNFNGYDIIFPIEVQGRFLKISGATPFNGVTYSDKPFTNSTAIEKIDINNGIFTISPQAKYVGINFLTSQNTGGYGNLHLDFDGSLVYKQELNQLKAFKGQNYEIENIIIGYSSAELGLKMVSSAYKSISWIPVKEGDILIIDNAIAFNAVTLDGMPGDVDTTASVLHKTGSIFIVPNNAKYIGINFLNSQNTNGYDKLRIYTGNESIVYSGKSDKYLLQSGIAYGYNSNELGEIIPHNDYTSLSLIETASKRIKVSGATAFNIVCFSDYPAKHTNAISKVDAVNGIFTLSDGTKYIGINFLNAQNTDGYDNLNILYDNNIDIEELKRGAISSSDIYSQSMLLINGVKSFPAVDPAFKDNYLVLGGDSITAYQSVDNLPDEGVTRVPAVCDRKANAYRIWQNAKFGNPQYRRFDDGKASLVSNWSDMWSDDSEAVFTESGTFKTEYMGADARTAVGNISAVQYTTLINYGTFPYQFDISENGNFSQRNIPKRFSNDSEASISFKIPAGYSKFDFIYHAHIYGDNVTITINRGNDIVKVNTKPNDWANAVEANGHSADFSLNPWIEEGGGNDSYGIPNKRLHFQITDTSADTVVTIKKSSDTTKYLIYWGMVYWGTSELPYCLNMDNMAIGGYSMINVYNLRSSIFKATQPTCIIEQFCLNDLNYKNYNEMQSVEIVWQNLKTYITRLNIPFASWIPHAGGTRLLSNSELIRANFKMATRIIEEKDILLLGSLYYLFQNVANNFYKEKSFGTFMNDLGDVHLNYAGYKVYKAFWEATFK